MYARGAPSPEYVPASAVRFFQVNLGLLHATGYGSRMSRCSSLGNASGPASQSNTLLWETSESRPASTHPAAPPPTIMTSYASSSGPMSDLEDLPTRSRSN